MQIDSVHGQNNNKPVSIQTLATSFYYAIKIAKKID